MKKLIIAGAAAIALIAAVAVPAMADAAVVVQDGGCMLPDGNGALTFVADSQQVANANNSKITCHGQVTPSPDGKAVHFSMDNTGVPCSTGFGLTNEWKAVVTPSGQATLTCHINPSTTP